MKKLNHFWWKAQVVTGLWMISAMAHAGRAFNGDTKGFNTTGDIGDVANGLAGQATDVGMMALSVAQVLGVFFGLAGVSDLKKNHDAPGQGYAAKGAMKIGAGVLGYFLPHVIGMGGQTLFP